MANKTIPALPDYGSQDSDKIRKDLLEITKNDGTYASPSYPTGATRKITVEDLKTALAITSQTVTNGVTTKSPSEDAVFDAIYAKGLVKSNAWKNNGVGTFTLEADKYNIVNYSNTNIEILLPAVEVDKTIIVQGTTQDGSGAVNFTINNIKIGGADLGTPYSVTVTNEKEVLILYGNYYGWHLIGHSNKTIDLSTYALLTSSITNGDTTHSPDGNAVFDALDLKEPIITKNTLSTPLVWTSANGVASFQPLPVLGDLTYYLTNTASDVATYYSQTTTPQVALTSLPFASVTNGQLLATFISEPNNPNRLSIPDGQYLNHLHLGKTGGTKSLQVRAEIWETTSAGVDVVKLADLGPSTLITGSGSTEYIIGYNTVEKTLSAVTSRIATKIYAVVGASGSATSISIFQGSSSDSRSNLPAPVVDATNYVPYTGALNDVDLGSKKITTTDIIVSGATASTPTFFDSAKKLITTTAQLWGTWVQTWASKATPVDADTIGFYNSASTFVGVKSTLLNFWTTYLLPKIQSLSYVSGTISSGYIPYFNGTSLANSNISHNQLTHSTIIVGSASYTKALSVYDNTGIIPLLSISNDATGASFRANRLTISSADNSRNIIIEPKGVSGYDYKPAMSIGTDSTNNQSTYTAYHFPTSTYTLVSNSAGQLMLFAINNTVGTLINAIHNKTGVQQGAWYNGGLLVGSGAKLASAVLQADSTTQGFLPPRMTNTQRTNIVSPAIGLMVYCTDTIEGLYIYKSTGWTFII